MFKDTKAFSGFSVSDIAAAKTFYGETLGIKVEETPMGLTLHFPGSNGVFIYPKPNHQPATYTVLNFPVANIDEAVDELVGKGVVFEHYTGPQIATDTKGVARGLASGDGPDIAWFRDPAGNILSVLQIS